MNQVPSTKKIRIALDAMGGDFAPEEIVKGAVHGARLYDVAVDLVGLPDAVQAELSKYETNGLDITVIKATEVVSMEDSPANSVRQKKDASINVAARLVGDGYAHALVAAGSTGAATAAATLFIGRLNGIKRPAIAITMPSLNKPTLLIDGGANADCSPAMLQQFAIMGSVFCETVLKIQRPRVGLLNIGTEEGKGNDFVQQVFPKLKALKNINFIGNVEGKHMSLDGADVIVTDGFTGNITLKAVEGMAKLISQLMKNAFYENAWTKLVGLLAKPIMDKAKKSVDHEEYGGALLLGLKKICVIAHGGSSAYAIQNAIRVAKEAVDGQVIEQIARAGQLQTEPAHA